MTVKQIFSPQRPLPINSMIIAFTYSIRVSVRVKSCDQIPKDQIIWVEESSKNDLHVSLTFAKLK